MVINKAQILHERHHAGGEVVKLVFTYNGHYSYFFEAKKLGDVLKEFGEWYKNQS